MENNISCKVIEDLLPLYVDEVCSEESEILVKEHISKCESCNKKLENIKSDLYVINSSLDEDEKEVEAFKSVSKKYKNKKLKSFLLGIGVTLVACVVVFVGYLGLFCWSVVPVATEELEVSEVSQLLDGRIAYRYKRDYSYPLMKIELSSDSQGNKYVTHYRPILPIGKGNIEDVYLYWVFDTAKLEDDDVDVEKVYVGNSKDRQLMWSEEMNLPKASKEAEDMLHPME